MSAFPVAMVLLLAVHRYPLTTAARSDIYRTVDAIERLAEFLDMHNEVITVDHALGVAIAQGQVRTALRSLGPLGESVGDLSGSGHLSDHADRVLLSRRLSALDAVLDRALKAVEVDGSNAQVTRRILQPWLWRVDTDGHPPFPRPSPSTSFPEGPEVNAPDALDALPSAQTVLELRELVGLGSPSEGESGRCTAVLLDQDGERGCSIPEDCIRAETDADGDVSGYASGYTNTHRLLFHHVARQVGCSLPDQNVGTQDEIERLCRSILREAEDISRARWPPLLRDLFTEQVAVCGLRGFTAFARPAWLDRLLSWQRPSGCFGNFTELQEAVEPFKVLRDNARLDDRLGTECLSHLTGVAAAAVAFNMRVLIQRFLLDMSDVLVEEATEAGYRMQDHH